MSEFWAEDEMRARIQRVDVEPARATAIVVVTDRKLGLRVEQPVYIFPPSLLFGGPTVSLETLSLADQVRAWAQASGRSEEEETEVYRAVERALLAAGARAAARLDEEGGTDEVREL